MGSSVTNRATLSLTKLFVEQPWINWVCLRDKNKVEIFRECNIKPLKSVYINTVLENYQEDDVFGEVLSQME